jgi:heptosyltransferase-2
MKIGIVLPNWIGDAAMATPMLRSLRSHFGEQATLLGIARPNVVPLFDGLTWLDQFITCGPSGRRSIRDTLSLVRALRRYRVDTMLLLPNSLRTGLIGWLSGARRRIGYVRYGRGPLLSDRIQPPRSASRLVPTSPVDYYLRLAEAVGCPPAPRDLELATTEREEELADQVWREHSLTRAACVIALNSGGAYGAAKHWPLPHCAELAVRLAQRPDTRVLVMCGPAERTTALEIERQAAHPRVISLARESLSLGLSKACVRRSQLLITTDSGPRHLAAAFGVPCLALFGPTDPRWSWNYHAGEVILQESLPCVPCARRTCPLGHHRCMTELSVERVYQSALRQLATVPACSVHSVP